MKVSLKATVAAVGVLMAALLVAVVILTVELRLMGDERAYRECMARHGYSADEAPRMPNGGADEYIAGLADAAEACGR